MIRKIAAAAATVLFAGLEAGSYIEALYPLQQMMAESEVIAEAVVEKTDTANRLSVIKLGKTLKGKCAMERMRLNVGVGRDWHPDALIPHLVPGAPAVVFCKADRETQVGMVYINRFFFQIYGDPNSPPDRAWWNFTNIEIRMNRTFYGTVPELSKLVSAILVGKTKAPHPDPRMPPITRQDVTSLPPWGAAEPDEKSLPAPFRKRPPLKPREPDNPPGIAPGISYRYYEGRWQAMPDFKALQPLKTGTAERFDLAVRGRDDCFALLFTGYILIHKDGTYVFHVSSGGGSRLYIGDTEVVTNDGSADESAEVPGEIPLKAGKHSIGVAYFQTKGNRMLKVAYEGPGIKKQAIPPSVLFHDPRG